MEHQRSEDFLKHHGILGMHWGIRRYQNLDGSLTAAGRARYLNDDGSYNETAKKELGVKAMTDSELKTAISRMQTEKLYAELKKQTTPEKKEGRIKKAINSILDKAVQSLSDKAANKLKDLITKDKYDKMTVDDLRALIKDEKELSKVDVDQLKKIQGWVGFLSSIESNKGRAGGTTSTYVPRTFINELRSWLQKSRRREATDGDSSDE